MPGRYNKHYIVYFTRSICLVLIVASCSKNPVIPAVAPSTLSAFAGSSNSFTAKWTIVSKVFYYELDVSSDNFVTFIPGYEALRVDTLSGFSSDIRAIKVTGLKAETNYQFRVRSIGKNSDGRISTSPNSSTVSICTDPATGTSAYVKKIAEVYSLITGTWEKYSNSGSIPWYPWPEPNGMTADGSSYCKDQRDRITFNNDSTIVLQSPQGTTLFSGSYKIDTAISIHGPSQYALVVQIPGYFKKDPFYGVPSGDYAFLNLAEDTTFMSFWTYYMGGGGQRSLTTSSKSWVRKK